jgi:hypothetical protein
MFKKDNAAVAVVYIALVIALISLSRGVPYVMDNNETWSNLGHAKNAFDYGFAVSKGLADEANEYSGNRPEAHPLVHTHQGNFPRLLATGLYALGVQTAGAQIAIISLTVGLAGLLLAYGLFRRALGAHIATLACLFMLTDYILFLQWQVNTWRVWQTVFLFGGLYCVERLGRERKSPFVLWLALFVVFACTFYSELIFASFVWVTCAVYALFRSWGRWKRLLMILCVLSAGAAMAGAVLALQLISYYGFDSLIQDAKYTISLRNLASDPAQRAEAIEFMQERNVLFLWNFNETGDLSLRRIINLFIYSFVGSWTPVFTSLVAIACAPAAWFWASQKALGHTCKWPAISPSGWLARGNNPRLASMVLAWIALFFFFNALLFSRIFGVVSEGSLRGLSLILSAAAASLLVWHATKTRQRAGIDRAELGPYVAVSVTLLAITYIVTFLNERVMHEYLPLWEFLLKPTPLLIAGFLVVTSASINLLLGTGINNQARLAKAFSRCLTILVSAACGFIFAALWAPGYLFTGYVDRSCPIGSYLLYTLPALGVWSLLGAERFSLSKKATKQNIAGLAAVGAIVATWLMIQARFVYIVPPTFASFTVELEKPRYDGCGLAVSNYVVPAAFSCKGWGWLCVEHDVGLGLVDPKPVQYEPVHFHIAWQGKRSEFARPDYFLHLDQPWSLRHATRRAELVLSPRGPETRRPPIIHSIESGSDTVFRNTVVAEDPSRWKAWTLVKLDQTPIPYLLLGENIAEPTTQITSLPQFTLTAPSKGSVDVGFIPATQPLPAKLPIFRLENQTKSQDMVAAIQDLSTTSGEDSSTAVAKGSILVDEGDVIRVSFADNAPSGHLIFRWQGRLLVFPYAKAKNNLSTAGPLDSDLINFESWDPQGSKQGEPDSAVFAVGVKIDRDHDASVVKVSPFYKYQQEGALEQGPSVWRLWKTSEDGSMSLIGQNSNGETFALSGDSQETFVVSVVPIDESHRKGHEYFSPPFSVLNHGAVANGSMSAQ